MITEVAGDSKIYIDDINTFFIWTIEDEDGAITLSSTGYILFEKPDGTVVQQSGTWLTDGADGKLYYATISGDLDQAGSWTTQAWIKLADGSWYSDPQPFNVFEPIIQV